MLSLPPIALDDDDGEYLLVLPMPHIEWVRLLAWQSSDRSTLELLQHLRDNPSLLVHTAISFRAEQDKPCESLVALGDWLGDRVNELLLFSSFGRPAESSSTLNDFPKRLYEFSAKHSLRRPLKKYLRSWNSKRIQFLSRFLSKLVCIPSHRADSLVSGSCSEILEAVPDDNPDAIKSKQSASATLDRWLDQSVEQVTVERLLTAYRNAVDQSEHFQHQLHQKKLESLHQLAYGASHEINNPLANIAARAQNLLAHEPDPNRRSKLGTIYEQAIRSHEMISDLMLFANPPALRIERIELKPFLFRLIRQAESKLNEVKAINEVKTNEVKTDALELPVSTTEPTGNTNGFAARQRWMETSSPNQSLYRPIQLIVRIAPGFDSFRGDSVQLNVALMALIQNGIESLKCSHGGTLEIRVDPQRHLMVFEVCDDGHGVSSSIAGHIFDPFFSGREAGRGLGFGLSKAWRIAQLHEGDLRFDPQHHPGARFLLEIPQVAP